MSSESYILVESPKLLFDSMYVLGQGPYVPVEGVHEALIVHEGWLSAVGVREALLRRFAEQNESNEQVYAGIEGYGYASTRNLIGQGSEAERDGITENGQFYATTLSQWRELDHTDGASPGGGNPFHYAARGWWLPAIAGFSKSKLIAVPEPHGQLWEPVPGETMHSALASMHYLLPVEGVNKLRARVSTSTD